MWFIPSLRRLHKGVLGLEVGVSHNLEDQQKKTPPTVCVGSVPAAPRHTAHLDFSSRVIGPVKSSSLPGPTDECGVGVQTADGRAAQTVSSDGGSESLCIGVFGLKLFCLAPLFMLLSQST